mgnify:CR=1 FL=1
MNFCNGMKFIVNIFGAIFAFLKITDEEYAMNYIKRLMLTVLGGILLVMGVVFILLPGPAILFLPIGLALLSLEFNWAKRGLRHCQRWMKKSALQMDKLMAKRRYCRRNH